MASWSCNGQPLFEIMPNTVPESLFFFFSDSASPILSPIFDVIWLAGLELVQI